MGRREDGAVVRDGLEIRLRTHRVGEPGNPAVGRCGAAELEQRTPTPRAMAGLRSRAIGPGARSWLTGAWRVHAHESAARHLEIRRMWSAGRRLVPSPGRGDASQASHRMVSPAIHRGSRTPPRLPALRSPRWGRRIGIRRCGVPGADQRTRAMARACTWRVERAAPVCTPKFSERSAEDEQPVRNDA